MTSTFRLLLTVLLAASAGAGCVDDDPPDPGPVPVTTVPSTQPVPPEPVPTDPSPPEPEPPDPSTAEPVPPEPEPEPEPDPSDMALATQFGLGELTVGAPVSALEAAAGAEMTVERVEGDCVVRYLESLQIATVDNDGAIQTYLVTGGPITTVEGVGIGSTYDDIVAAYPLWVAGLSGETTSFGGRYVPIEISSPGVGADYGATGRHMMFEMDADDRVARFRVGAPPYVFHTDICSSP
ncbi:hypothetical protein [Aquipuribacter sp. SD81]|uniref:hypothetical protein n=1 Tax=Aquipuribacter sp. SD81 TaxID=3127703 RepID=UPI003019FDD4